MTEPTTMTNAQLVCASIAKNEVEYQRSLPAHISPAKFVRTAQSAIASTPGLAECTKQSIYLAVERAAKDGLIIDGKEAAIVVFNKNIAKKGEPDRWVKEAQYMPMVKGLMQLARNSGIVSTPVMELVYESEVKNGSFIYWVKNGVPQLEHRPDMFNPNRGKPVGVYATCVIRGSNELIAEILTAEQVENIRNQSKAKNSLMWTTFKEEGWKKAAFRRLFKRLPSSTDKTSPEFERFTSAMQRDDDLYEFEDDAPMQDATPEKKPTKAAQTVKSAEVKQEILPPDEEIPFDDAEPVTYQEGDLI